MMGVIVAPAIQVIGRNEMTRALFESLLSSATWGEVVVNLLRTTDYEPIERMIRTNRRRFSPLSSPLRHCR